MSLLIEVAKSQSHATYCAFVHGLSSKWSYVLQILDVEPHLLQPLDHQIRTQLFTVISSQSAPNDLIHDLTALPAGLRGLNLLNPLKSESEQFVSSLSVTPGPIHRKDISARPQFIYLFYHPRRPSNSSAGAAAPQVF